MRARVIASGEDGLPVVYDLPVGQQATIGRNHNNTIVLRDDLVSRHHAVIFQEGEHWVIRDLEARNGTFVDGRRVQDKAVLHDGQEIVIGTAPLRFIYEGETIEGDVAGDMPPDAESVASSAYPTTALRTDELTVLYGFTVACMMETDAHTLLHRALQTVHTQTMATVTAFLNLDEADPLPKMVLPETTHFDTQISRYLTQRVQQENRAVWLDPAPGEELGESDSLLVYADAMCIPMRGESEPLGALHVYRTGQPFTKRDFRFCEILARHLATSLSLLRARRTLEAENVRLRRHSSVPDCIRGESKAIQELKHRITRAAAGPKPPIVLIIGESGVGKELVALELHRQSPRREAPMIAFNCATADPQLVQSQLFGHLPGAFTDAREARQGLFKQADEGTLFLDEIAELGLPIQAKLLRAIETGVFRPVGTDREDKVDTRLIAATNRNLADEVKAGRFREDLYWRLHVVEIHVPPLRERLDDIPELVEHFLDRLRADYHRKARVTPQAMRRLQEYEWPGNVRQLRTALESALVMNDSGVLDVDDFRLGSEVKSQDFPSLKLKDLELWAAREALKRTEGNRTAGAKMLGVSRETFHNILKRGEAADDVEAQPAK